MQKAARKAAFFMLYHPSNNSKGALREPKNSHKKQVRNFLLFCKTQHLLGFSKVDIYFIYPSATQIRTDPKRFNF